jgi:7-cyano-7-deazaguanine reductase
MSHESPLGKATTYSSQYDPELLFAIQRADSRSGLDPGRDLPFGGTDYWTAWELTWLNASGVPQVAAADIRVPCSSPALVESKSLKLYLNSFTMSRFENSAKVCATIAADLTRVTGAVVDVSLFTAGEASVVHEFPGSCIDSIATGCDAYEVDASLLSAGSAVVSETLHSHLLRSLCPVTDQPDIGSVLVSYTGPAIDRAGLLRYIVSYREHHDFHEACVERMFIDIQARCRPTQLTVLARYQRRGGLDINPFRSNFESAPGNNRLWRQ